MGEDSRRIEIRRDLASRVEEQGERIAMLSRELDEARSAMLRAENELAESREEQNRLQRQIDRLTQAKNDADAAVERQQTTIAEVKNDARRLAEEVVRLQAELKSAKSGAEAGEQVSAIQEVLDGYQDQTARLRREVAHTSQALESLRTSYREVESEILALQRASNEMIATQYLDEVLASILTGVEEGLGYDLAVLMVLDRAGGYFFPRVRPDNALAQGARTDLGLSFEKIRIPVTAEGNALAALVENPTLTVQDSPKPMLIGAEPGLDAERLGAYLVTKGEQIFAAVPMIVRGQVAGALFCSRARASISPRERESLQNFSNQAGMAVENVQLVADMKRARDEVSAKNVTLQTTNEKLVELEKTKEALTSMMVHDMKNPLTSIRGYLELLLDEPAERLTDDLRRHVKISYESSGRLLDMVRDLLDISKMEAGKFRLHPETVDLGKLIAAAFTEQSVIATRSGKKIEVVVAEDLPHVAADADLVGRVIVNLLSNSVKHTPRGSRIEISLKNASVYPQAPSGSAVVVAIADNGDGIPKQFQEKIFEKFGTIESRAQGAPKLSTGLGLTFCKMAVEAHGGRIWLESEQGHGATFYFSLPPAPPA